MSKRPPALNIAGSLTHVKKDSPHDFETSETTEAEHNIHKRRVRIVLKDLYAHGFAQHCPKCDFHREGKHRRAHVHGHTEACRERLYQAHRNSGSGSGKMIYADAVRQIATTNAEFLLEIQTDPRGSFTSNSH